MDVVLETSLSLPLHGRGKVRDIYDVGDHLLLVATDRISAFDSVLPNGIPRKGEVLNKLSAFWFGKTKALVKNHMVSIDLADFPEEVQKQPGVFGGRSMLAVKAKPLPIECVARGYLAGSGWKEYQQSKTVCGLKLPDGLVESDKLPETLYTPATKAETGHDINIPYEETVKLIGEDLAAKVRDYTISIYELAAKHLEKCGIILCDTKFEFGLLDDELVLIDEVLTPDSSRFWPKDSYSPGGAQKSYDKQYVRDYLLSIKWDKEPPAPELPDEVVKGTSEKYVEAYKLITGKEL